ncbi:glycosyltransferase family 2 protein [Tessaracoccus palaemonis]|uniref:Glycosyltransferase n=1 Tax=Tessaracoccus palaemonis TaxID=2829499 RepID=A0ABX8SL24_9ACTN|nr:cellulose synthase catalytic subunit [Tessaracoccus palaemonis]QXT62698.1 glycosyltransferase [Tessaracoccus palaemonis]
MASLVHDYASVDAFDDATRRAATRETYSPVMILLTTIATIGILFYGWFLFSPGHRGDVLPWLLVIVSETILVMHALAGMWTILAGRERRDWTYYATRTALYDPSDPRVLANPDDPTTWPLRLGGRIIDVDVLITVYGEPLDVIRRTAEAAMAVRGRHKTWILDDGRSDEVQALASELGCRYVRRMSSSGAKAGNVNNALTIAKGEFFVILDADFVPLPGLLEETLPFFEDSTVAFVQTPQTYGNLHNFISRGAGYMQTMFYRFVQPGRNSFNAAFCVGTNVVFRRAAVDDIGGIYTDSKSEDVWTSLTLHGRGWRSIFLPVTLAIGDAPDTIEGYSKQQLRWATGGFEILFTSNPLITRRRLSLDQRLMYFVTATHYLTGIVPGLLLFVPALEIFFDLRPVSMDIGIWQWFLAYSGFYLLQVVLAFFTLGSFRWEVLMLSAASFPIYMLAFFNVVIGRDQAWSVTGAKKGAASPFNFIFVQVTTFVFLLATTCVGVWRDLLNSQLTIATVWCGINTVILGAFILVAFDEARSLRRGTAEAEAMDAKSVALSEFLGAPEPRSTPYTRVRDELAARAVELDEAAPSRALNTYVTVPLVKEPVK